MKVKFRRIMMMLAFTTVTLSLACRKSDGMTDKNKVAVPVEMAVKKEVERGNVEVNYGWLRFPTKQKFIETMELLHSKYPTAKGLNEWERGMKGYTSLRKTYEQIDADNSEDRTAPTVDSLIKTGQLLDCPDNQFASVLSGKGFIQIADTVYSVKPGTKGEAFAVPDRHALALSQGVEAATLDGSKAHLTSFIFPVPRWPETGKVTKGPARLSICFNTGGGMGNWWGQVGGDIYGGDDNQMYPEHNGRTVKLNYERWRVGFIFYASTGVRLKMLKHTRFAGWQSVTYAEEMIMEACVKGKIIAPGFPIISFTEQTSPQWPYFYRQTENVFEKTLKWSAALVMNDIFLEHFNFHFKVNYRGRIAERNIRQ